MGSLRSVKVETFADQLFFTTVHLSGSDWVATGFVYGVDTEKGTAHFLITNRHVLEGVDRFVVRMILSDGGSPSGPVLGSGVSIDVHGLTDEIWRGQASELDSLEDVVFVGYPSGIYDSVSLLPIARRGTTATPVAVDYRGLPAFLIDASVFPGSSGSPVFLAQTGVTMVRGQGLVVGHTRPPCLGVLAAVHVRQLQGLLSELPTRLGVTFDEPVDLGIVFKASAFDECVDPLLAAAELERAKIISVVSDEPTEADAQIADEIPAVGQSHE